MIFDNSWYGIDHFLLNFDEKSKMLCFFLFFLINSMDKTESTACTSDALKSDKLMGLYVSDDAIAHGGSFQNHEGKERSGAAATSYFIRLCCKHFFRLL